jgi:hypothetical protein
VIAVTLLSAFSAFAILAGCAGQSPIQTELNSNESKWADQKVSHYRYTLRVLAFAPVERTAPVDIEVRDGIAVSALYQESGQGATNEIIRNADTVEKLFDIIQNAIDDKVDEVTVEYDTAYGYPKGIRIDPLKTAIDEEIGYTVSEFQVLE